MPREIDINKMIKHSASFGQRVSAVDMGSVQDTLTAFNALGDKDARADKANELYAPGKSEKGGKDTKDTKADKTAAKGSGNKLEKGSRAAKDRMAEIRGMRGKVSAKRKADAASDTAKSGVSKRGKAEPRGDDERDLKRSAARDQTKSGSAKRGRSRSKLKIGDDSDDDGPGLLAD